MNDPLDSLDPETRDLLNRGRAEWDAAYDEYLERWSKEILARTASEGGPPEELDE